MNTPPLITEYGKRLLGKVIKDCREQKGWSLDEVVAQIRLKTGHKLSKTTLNNLERGYTTPSWDTLALLAEVGFIYVNLKGKKQMLSAHDMFDIASEQADLPSQSSRIKKIRQGLMPKTADSSETYPGHDENATAFLLV